jgi:hypothetical protein
VCVKCKKVKAPKTGSAGPPPGTKQVPDDDPEAGPQGPDSDHRDQGTKTARPDPPNPGQEDERRKRSRDAAKRTAISAKP